MWQLPGGRLLNDLGADIQRTGWHLKDVHGVNSPGQPQAFVAVGVTDKSQTRNSVTFLREPLGSPGSGSRRCDGIRDKFWLSRLCPNPAVKPCSFGLFKMFDPALPWNSSVLSSPGNAFVLPGENLTASS